MSELPKTNLSAGSGRFTDKEPEQKSDNERLNFPVQESNKSLVAGKLRYWWSWFAAGVLLLFIATPLLVVLLLINKKMWLYPIARWGADLWLKACGTTVEVTGRENLVPERQYIFIANHRSYLDTAALFFHTGRRIGLVAKKELLKVPVLGQGMHYVNIFAIDRTDPEKALRSLEKAKRIIEKGFSFGIFAEGTRAMPGELLPFKKGAFHLAAQTGAAIVPVAFKNTDILMGKGTGVAFPGTIRMVLLPPVETTGTGTEIMPLLERVRGAIAAELTKP